MLNKFVALIVLLTVCNAQELSQLAMAARSSWLNISPVLPASVLAAIPQLAPKAELPAPVVAAAALPAPLPELPAESPVSPPAPAALISKPLIPLNPILPSLAPLSAPIAESPLAIERPIPYAWGYETLDDYGTKNIRRESGDASGAVRGSYAFAVNNGVARIVDYVADKDGFRAAIRSNEPGIETSAPASVLIENSSPVAAKPVAAVVPVPAEPAKAEAPILLPLIPEPILPVPLLPPPLPLVPVGPVVPVLEPIVPIFEQIIPLPPPLPVWDPLFPLASPKTK